MLLERLLKPKNPQTSLNSVSSEVEVIVSQYRDVVGALDQMFGEMDLRSSVMAWRTDGYGSCLGVKKALSEQGLIGVAKERLIELREEKSRLNPKKEKSECRCPYHRVDSGCILGDLKSPLCIGFVDFPGELPKRFGINAWRLRGDIEMILKAILTQDPDGNCSFEEEMIPADEFVVLSKEAISKMTKHVQKFPLIESRWIPEATV